MKLSAKNQKGAYLFTGSLAIVASLMLLSSCQQHTDEEYAALESKANELESTLNERDSVINDMIQTFDQIENSLEEIKKQRQIVSLQSEQVEMSADKKAQIIQDVQSMNKLLAESRDKIKSLDSKLKNSGLKITGLEKRITQLEQDLTDRNNDLEQLRAELVKKDFEVSQISEQVTDLTAQVSEQKSVIDDKENQLNTAFIVSGTYQELRDKGIVSKEGGILGLGSSKALNDAVGQENFSKIDITTATQFPVHSAKAHLITSHPEGSYKFVTENDQIAYLEIENPSEFWKMSKYAVMEVK